MDNGKGEPLSSAPAHKIKEGNFMALEYKIDVLQALKDKGFNTSRLRKEKLLPESTIQKLREGKPINWASISKICVLLDCQPGDILESKGESE